MDYAEGFFVHPSAETAINTDASYLLSSVGIIHPAKRSNSVPIEAPKFVITEANLLDEPVLWSEDEDGRACWIFTTIEGQSAGIKEPSLDRWTSLLDRILKIDWARDALSKEFIEDAFVNWARQAISMSGAQSFTAHLVGASSKSIRTYEAWLPVQNLTIEDDFDFGPVRFARISTDRITEFKRELEAISGDKGREGALKYGEMLQSKLQGCTAVLLQLKAEAGYAAEAAHNAADDAVGLLRFFSEAGVNALKMSPVALKDNVAIPSVHVLLRVPGESFIYKERIRMDIIALWHISNAMLAELKAMGLDDIGCLFDTKSLNAFGCHVRASILALSKAFTYSDISEKLAFAFSAIEGLLLTGSEPIQDNVSTRLAFLVTSDPAFRRKIVKDVKSAYNLRSQFIHHRMAVQDVKTVETFLFYADVGLRNAAKQVDRFPTRDQFIEAIELKRFSG